MLVAGEGKKKRGPSALVGGQKRRLRDSNYEGELGVAGKKPETLYVHGIHESKPLPRKREKRKKGRGENGRKRRYNSFGQLNSPPSDLLVREISRPEKEKKNQGSTLAVRGNAETGFGTVRNIANALGRQGRKVLSIPFNALRGGTRYTYRFRKRKMESRLRRVVSGERKRAK